MFHYNVSHHCPKCKTSVQNELKKNLQLMMTLSWQYGSVTNEGADGTGVHQNCSALITVVRHERQPLNIRHRMQAITHYTRSAG
jgi:hypothetical protein